MPVLNDSEKLYLGSILVDKVMYGERQIWPPLPVLESITPSTSVEPPTTCVVEIYGSNFIVGSDVCWVNSKTPNNAPFASAATYRDSTHLTTTLHHLAANNDFLVWVRSNRNNEVSNRVSFPVTSAALPPPVITAFVPPSTTIDAPITSFEIIGTGFVTGAVVWSQGSPLPTTFNNGGSLTVLWNSPTDSDMNLPYGQLFQVQNPDGQISNMFEFLIYAP